ncbi:MAG: DUF2461 domain-containing protein [Angelakisella sp.]|jgi:uncharacterized protein (TIGR02453 family)|nr:DUF2461 domain-containing protein [Angelakisella sp.]
MSITPQFFSFLVENRLHDSKPWFEAHREEYNRLVLSPLRALVQEMAPIMLTIDPELITQPAVGKTISRIFRDTRFSRDKSTFREHLWISFSRGKAGRYEPVPELYFDLSPEGYSYGCGWYSPGPQLMETLRRLVLEGDKTAKAAIRAAGAQTHFKMEGSEYKRKKHPDAPAELQLWLNCKELYFAHRDNDPEFLYAPDLGERVARELTRMKPVYQLFWKAQSTARAEEIHTSTALNLEEW